MADIMYRRTWCEYLTPCPHREGVEVGSYECEQCRHHADHAEEKSMAWSPDRPRAEFIQDYRKYSEIINGIVKCKHEQL